MKTRLDQALVSRSLIESRSKARALIQKGSVKVNQTVVTKVSFLVGADDVVQVLAPLDYVSRGGEKLQSALEHFHINVQDQIILDVGASTGGVTDCLLQRGAAHVYCIDVGSNQLHPTLRTHVNVTFLENHHVDQLCPQTFDQTFSWVVMDVSFISMHKALDHVWNVRKPKAQVLALFKPQFEAPRSSLSHGVLRSEEQRIELLQASIQKVKNLDRVQNVQSMDVAIKGPKGNQESMLWIQTL